MSSRRSLELRYLLNQIKGNNLTEIKYNSVVNTASADGRTVSTLRYKDICMPIESWPCYCLVCVRDWHLTYWGRVTHICVGNLTIIGSNNGLSPGWRQAINWTNAGMLLVGRVGTNFSEILIQLLAFLPLSLSGRRGIVVACVCPSVRPSVRP